MVGELEILEAIEKGDLVSGIDPLQYAVLMKVELKEKDPVLWAIDNNKKIDGKDAVLFSLINNSFDVNNDILKYVKDKNYQINVGDDAIYSVDEFKEKIVSSIVKKQEFLDLAAEDLMKIAINGNFAIKAKSPIQYAIENNPTSLVQGVKNILKIQGNDNQLKDFYEKLAKKPKENQSLIELFANEFNLGGRGKENFVTTMFPLVEAEIKMPDSLVNLYIKDQLEKGTLSVEKIHPNHKEQALFSVIDLYLDEYTNKEDKGNLKAMHAQLAKDLSLDTDKQKSPLVQFVSDPEECANKINNLINKLPKQTKSDLDIAGSAKSLDLEKLYKNYDLETLDNLSKIGKKLDEVQPEVKSLGIASKIGIALAIITVIPGIILGIIKLASNASKKQEFKEQQSEALQVNQELNELGVKSNDRGVQMQSNDASKFTEKVLSMRLNAKGGIGMVK